MGGRGAGLGHISSVVSMNAVEWAKTKIGSGMYGRNSWNRSLFWGTVKCNQFVEHAFNFANPSANPIEGEPSRTYTAVGIGRMRSHSANEIYNGRLKNFKIVKNPQPGDIAADGTHVGIVSGKDTTISASAITNKVVENNWGFHNGKPQKGMRFYRYDGENHRVKK